MSRDFFINGESLVFVKGNPFYAGFGTLQQLGLAAGPIRITPNFRHMDINLEAWGQAPADVQWMLCDVNISMNLIHFDRTVLDVCLACSMGGGNLTSVGLAPTMARAGTRLGGGSPPSITTGAIAPGSHNFYIRLSISSLIPAPAKPWLFFSSYLTGPPMEFPLGTEKSIVNLNWRAIPYTADPANPIGNVPFGASNFQIWDYVNDS